MKSPKLCFFKIVVVLFLLQGVWGSLAAWPPTYGPEFALTNTTIAKNKKKEKYLKKLRQSLNDQLKTMEGEPPFKIKKDNWGADFSIKFKDGFVISYTTDPGVIEIITSPNTRQEFKDVHAARVQQYVFDLGASHGLVPWDFLGGGHIHLGRDSTFGKDGFLLRQFVADFRNHPALAMGALNHDTNNSIAFAELEEEVRLKFAKKISKLDGKPRENLTPLKFAEIMMDISYSRYRALNFNNMENEAKTATLEVRCIRPQKSAAAYLKLITLFEKRIEYLKTIKEPIPFTNPPPVTNPHEAMQQFYEYVVSSGLKWEDYKEFVMPSWHQNGLVESFVPKKDFVRLHERITTACGKLSIKAAN